MIPLVLYCKSYRTDLKRVVRLSQSIQQFNIEKLPFYISVPDADLLLFKEHLAGLNVNLLSDEQIIDASPRIDAKQLQPMSGSLTQQIVKSEFWRLGLSDAYLCLDSDAFFIRPFGLADFMAADGTPYTMMDEAHDLMEDALRHGKSRVIQAFANEARTLQQIFGREGRAYSFGPLPVVWHRAVWESLDTQYLQPRSMSFADAIAQAPIETRWYGEALLRYKAVPLLPCQALFKVYHYAWQLNQDHQRGIDHEQLSPLYGGVIYQSAWEREMDWPAEGGGVLSRLGRRIRRRLGRI